MPIDESREVRQCLRENLRLGDVKQHVGDVDKVKRPAEVELLAGDVGEPELHRRVG